MTWRNKRSGVTYKQVWWEREKNPGTLYAMVKVQSYKGGTGWVLSSNVVEVMEDEPEFEIIGDYDEVTITDEVPDAQLVSSESDWPNIHPILREMSYNAGLAYTSLTNIVVVKDADVLYELQVAHATISDEIRRLSDKEE